MSCVFLLLYPGHSACIAVAGAGFIRKPRDSVAGRLSKDGQWRSLPKVPKLLEYVPNGAYYAQIKVHGKVIRRHGITTTIRCSRTTENPGRAGARPATRKTGPLTLMAHQASFHHANHRFQLQTPGQRPGGPESDFLSSEVEDNTLLWFTSDNRGDYVSGASVEPAPSSGEKKKNAMKGDSQ